jgi:3-hydroxyisobutyrate dehydrogenase-like beta-hydroxyacid dehydrogenase
VANSDTDAISDVVGLGLGPMGLPVAGRPVPAGITVEFDREVHAHGDRFAPPGGLSAATVALSIAGDERSAGELAQLAIAAGEGWGLSAGDRAMLATPYDDERILLAGLLVPLAAGSAAVLCRNLDRLDEQALARRIAEEGVTVVTDPLARFLGSQPRHLE